MPQIRKFDANVTRAILGGIYNDFRHLFRDGVLSEVPQKTLGDFEKRLESVSRSNFGASFTHYFNKSLPSYLGYLKREIEEVRNSGACDTEGIVTTLREIQSLKYLDNRPSLL